MSESEKSEFIINNSELLETTFNKDSIIDRITTQLISCND